MTKAYEYTSGLSVQIQSFITEKRSLGCKYEKEAKTFYEMDKFLVKEGVTTPVLTQDVVEKWVGKRPNEKRKNQRWRLNFTKRFVSYLVLHHYDAYYPEHSISANDDKCFVPYIFTNKEIGDLIEYFYSIKPSRQYPLGHLVIPLLFLTLICCGLRSGEAASLKVKDVDIENGILTIRNAKHGKSRSIPIAESMRLKYAEYHEHVHTDSDGEDYFFPNARGNCHHTNVIESRFKEALWNCGIPYRGRDYGPRVHDFRHTFAVRAMQKIRKEKGSNLIALPYLSVYLGHYNMNKTQQYLHLVADAFPELIELQQNHLGDIIPTWEAPE